MIVKDKIEDTIKGPKILSFFASEFVNSCEIGKHVKILSPK